MPLEPRAAAYQLLARTGVPQLWHGRTEQLRRSTIAIGTFLVIVWLYAFSSSTPTAPGFYPHGALEVPALVQHNVVADVGEFAVLAVADSDGAGDGASAAADADAAPASALARGTLRVRGGINAQGGRVPKSYSLSWGSAVDRIEGTIARHHTRRGMELSTLQFWNGGKLLACDDHTGVVYEIMLDPDEGVRPRAVPRFVLADGDGDQVGPMACEWSAVKGDYLVVGASGKPWTRIDDAGRVVIEHANAQWAKMISPAGSIRSLDWREPYEKMRAALGVPSKGYVAHQCGLWSSRRQQWFFIPRHVSYTAYRPGDEHAHGSTAIVIADASFKTIRVVPLQGASSAHAEAGVTDCKFVPNGYDTEIMIIKVAAASRDGSPRRQHRATPAPSPPQLPGAGDGLSGGAGLRFQSFASIVDVDGRVLMNDVPLPSGWKFEGLELLPVVHRDH